VREGRGRGKKKTKKCKKGRGGGWGGSYVEREKRDIMGRDVTCAGGRGMRVETGGNLQGSGGFKKGPGWTVLWGKDWIEIKDARWVTRTKAARNE
jgi:hypothetical protein